MVAVNAPNCLLFLLFHHTIHQRRLYFPIRCIIKVQRELDDFKAVLGVLLVFRSLHFASPVLRIRVENKAMFIREAKIEYQQKGQDRKH